MAKCRIAYDDLIRKATVIAVSSEDPQFPAEYTQDDNVSELAYRSLAAGLSITIDYDLGSAKTYNYIVLLNHRCTNGATIQVIGADNAAFSSGVVTDTLTFNGNNIRQYLGTARTKRYVRLSIADASNPDGFIQVSIFRLFSYFEPSRSFGPRQHGVIDGSQVSKTPSLARFLVQAQPTPEGMVLPFKGEKDSDWATFMAMWKEVGAKFAFDIVFDPSAPNTYGYWVTLTEITFPERQAHDYWVLLLSIEEQS